MRTDMARGEKLLMERHLTGVGSASATVRAVQQKNGGLLVMAYLPPGIEVGDFLMIRRPNCEAWSAVFQQMYYRVADLIGEVAA